MSRIRGYNCYTDFEHFGIGGVENHNRLHVHGYRPNTCKHDGMSQHYLGKGRRYRPIQDLCNKLGVEYILGDIYFLSFDFVIVHTLLTRERFN